MTKLRLGSVVLALWAAFANPVMSEDLAALLADARTGGDEAALLYVLQGKEAHVSVAGKLRAGGRNARPGDRFVLASVGKIFTAVAILQLAEAGKLGIDDPVSNWIDPDVAGSLGLSGVSLRHLLTMTSGIVDYYTDDYLDEVLEEPAAQTPVNALRYAEGSRLFAPGTQFDYSNTNYLLLQLVLEQASGQSMSDYMQRTIFDGLGMEQTYVFGTRAHPNDFVAGYEDLGTGPEDVSFYYLGQGFGDGGVISTAKEIAGFYRSLFVRRELLNDQSLDMMLNDPVGEGYGMGVEIANVPGLGLVYGHSGADLGFSADVRLAVQSGDIAVALFASGEADGAVTEEALALLSQ